MYEAQDALVARADLLPALAVRELARPDDMEPLAVDPKSSTSGVAGGAPRRPPPMTHRESMAEASESLMPETACTSATAQGQHLGDQQGRGPGCRTARDVVGEPGLALRAFLDLGAARPRTRCRAALDGVDAVGAAGIDGDRLLDDGLAQVVAHLLVRLRALAPGTLLSVCDGGRPEFRLVPARAWSSPEGRR